MNTFKKRLEGLPLMDEATALEVLDAAVKAYDNGKGIWPTMSVEERISCMYKFLQKMKEEDTGC